ncbi:glycosyltransferase family 4 protein [Thiobacillus denitrificans]|uniref:Glycosyltransferase n=1 Tax=Thiobacillus denitrificans TaxID=36861 RepID=A0A106BR06_THIDE|nr:glycosyltransferase family 4 protein [Thiobacillus denitrificans]KVW97032.1 glycosyltransferase [Thiobacillus denitrificans]
MNKKPIVCFFTNSCGDWGGASRVLYTNLWQLDTTRLDPILILPCKGPIEPELKAHGLRYEVWSGFTEPGSPAAYVRALWKAWRFFRRERVEVVHVNGSNFWRPAELLAARLAGIPILAHYHVINHKPSPAMRWCRAAIAVSHYTADQSGPPALAKPVIYNPISLARFDAGHSLREELGLGPDQVVVAFLGQIRDIKGVADFIAMARKIPDPNARFLIAGECRDPKKFPGSYSEQDLGDMVGDDPRIRYIGYVKAVENVYHTADIVVVPSRWQEPLGLINLEAGACRKPVVATRVGGIPEVVEDGVNGYLVEPEDVDGLTARVADLIADPSLRARMGEAGRARVEQDFTTCPVRAFETLLLGFVRP